MNYIAHLHLAHLANSSLLGNFLGDFAKGSDLSHLPPHVQEGVMLHRRIDSFTDAHPEIALLRTAFPKTLRRMSGVILDIYFDHLLCCHWERFNTYELDHLLLNFYQELAECSFNLPGRFPVGKRNLLEHRWLNQYHDINTCYRAFMNIEKRLNHRISFAQEAFAFIQSEHTEIETAFLRFYPQVIKKMPN